MDRRRRVLAQLILAIGATGLGCGGRAEEGRTPPRLTVVVVVDQLRGDALSAGRTGWSAGFARLVEAGVVFVDAHHDHACTVTASGHATLATGRHPSGHGIVGNQWLDRASGVEVASIDDPEVRTLDGDEGASPRRLRATTLGDWLVARYPGARVVSVSRKDRAAILSAGHAGEDVYWYSERTGGLTSSTFYRERLPTWIEEVNQRAGAARRCGQAWELLRGERAGYPGADADDAPWEPEGVPLGRTFPHRLPEDSEACAATFPETPFADELVLEGALAAVDALALGSDDQPDLLLVSFSALDSIGHRWGPSSLEVADTLARLDAMVGGLLSELERRVGREHLLVVLTSDHGVAEIPERAVASGRTGGRLPLAAVAEAAEAAVSARLGEGRWLREIDSRWLWLDRAAIEAAGGSPEAAAREVAAAVAALEGVHRAVPRADLLAGRPPADDLDRRLRHAADPDRVGDVAVVLEPGWLPGAPGASNTTHGSPWPADTHVPLVVLGPGLAPRTVERTVATVDLAPTLAAWLGLSPGAALDGTALAEAVAFREAVR